MLNMTKAVLCGIIALLMTSLSTRCPAQTIAVKSGDSIAFMGDSITEQAWDSANGHWGWNSPVGHIHLVMNALEANGIMATAIPGGRSGHTSRDMLKRLQTDVLDKKPTWLILSCGVNDVGPWNAGGKDGVLLSEYKSNITAIVERSQAAGVNVMVSTITPIYEDQPTNDANRLCVDYNNFLRALAREKKCLLVDLSADMLARRAELGNKGNTVTSDGVHLNTEGSFVWATGILRAFGFKKDQIGKAREAWLDIPNAVKLPGQLQSVSMRELAQLQKLADRKRSRLDVLISETFAGAISNLLKTAESGK
jgi:lysophospholipase L1-like esterase